MDEQAKLLDCDDVLREQLALCEARLESVLAQRDELDAQSKTFTGEANHLRAMRDRYKRALEPITRKARKPQEVQDGE